MQLQFNPIDICARKLLAPTLTLNVNNVNDFIIDDFMMTDIKEIHLRTIVQQSGKRRMISIFFSVCELAKMFQCHLYEKDIKKEKLHKQLDRVHINEKEKTKPR